MGKKLHYINQKLKGNTPRRSSNPSIKIQMIYDVNRKPIEVNLQTGDSNEAKKIRLLFEAINLSKLFYA